MKTILIGLLLGLLSCIDLQASPIIFISPNQPFIATEQMTEAINGAIRINLYDTGIPATGVLLCENGTVWAYLRQRQGFGWRTWWTDVTLHGRLPSDLPLDVQWNHNPEPCSD